MFQAQTAYGRTLGTTTSVNRGEYTVFARVTARLIRAKEEDAPVGARAVALHDNRKLWTEVGILVADDANALPYDLRQRLFALSVFVQSYSSKVFAHELDIEPLIEINRMIMAGLKAQTREGAAA